MAALWFAPHAAGFGKLVIRLAQRDYPGSTAVADGDNAIRLSLGPSPPMSVPRAMLAYCRGLFRVLAEARGGLEQASREIARDPRTEAAVAAVSRGGRVDARAGGGPRAGRRGATTRAMTHAPTFVLRSFGPDDPASLPRDTRAALEELIARRTGARPDSERPQREFRIQERSDGTTLFLERVVNADEPAPRRGELPRTTCRLLAEMTQPEAGDVFLDPFCGYGGIALERALAAPYRFVFASDHEPEKVEAVRASLYGAGFEKRRRTIFPKVRDALNSSAFDEGFVTAIATDPPWGLYEGGPGESFVRELLCNFFSEAARLLTPGGRLVILTARGTGDDPWRELIRPYFAQRERYDVLISGKKAKVIRFERGEWSPRR